MGTPKRCADPMTMSAPHSPGGVSMVQASRSVATTILALASCVLATRSCSTQPTLHQPVAPSGAALRKQKLPVFLRPASHTHFCIRFTHLGKHMQHHANRCCLVLATRSCSTQPIEHHPRMQPRTASCKQVLPCCDNQILYDATMFNLTAYVAARKPWVDLHCTRDIQGLLVE